MFVHLVANSVLRVSRPWPGFTSTRVEGETFFWTAQPTEEKLERIHTTYGRFVTGMAAILMTAILVVGCAGANDPAIDNNDSSQESAPAPVSGQELKVDATYWAASVWDPDQQVQQLFAVSKDRTVYCGPENGAVEVSSQTGCEQPYTGTTEVRPLPYEEMVENYNQAVTSVAFESAKVYATQQGKLVVDQGFVDGELGVKTGRLTFQPGITGQDCYGPKGPRYLVSCTTAEEGNLWFNPEEEIEELYVGRFTVATYLSIDNKCYLVPIIDPCGLSPEGHTQECVKNPAAQTPAAIGMCVALVECESATEEADCDDGDACTEDVCGEDGWCDHLVVTCDDAEQCTTDTCNALTGCVFTPKQTGVCNDNNLCTSEACQGGVCVSTANDCDDANPCTADSCDMATGDCVYTPTPTVLCNDGDACTTGEVCNEEGKCVGNEIDPDDGNPCTADSCDPDTGEIAHNNLPAGSSCQLGGGGSGVCNAAGACTADFCTFTVQEVASGLVKKGACVEVAQEAGSAILTHRVCLLIPGTQIGLWQSGQECGPLGAVMECDANFGCTMCAPGYCVAETACNDGLDNDEDGMTDCSDPDCANDSVCSSGVVNATYTWTMKPADAADGFTVDEVFVDNCPEPTTFSVAKSSTLVVISFMGNPTGCVVHVTAKQGTSVYWDPGCWPSSQNYSSIPSATFPDANDDGIADACNWSAANSLATRTLGCTMGGGAGGGTTVGNSAFFPNPAGDGLDEVLSCP